MKVKGMISGRRRRATRCSEERDCGRTMPTLVRVDGRWELVDDVEVRDLEDYEAFPAWDHAAARSAAGVDRPLDLRLA